MYKLQNNEYTVYTDNILDFKFDLVNSLYLL